MNFYRLFVAGACLSLITGSMVVEAESFAVSELSAVEVIEGPFAMGRMGSALEKGDFNGDGIVDLLVSHPGASTSLMTSNGAVSIYFGGEDLVADINFFGARPNVSLGKRLVSGDFNGDSIDDIAMSSDGDNEILLIFGRENWQKKSYNFEVTTPDLILENEFVDYKMSSLDKNVDKSDILFTFSGNSAVVYMFEVDNVVSRRISFREELIIKAISGADDILTNSDMNVSFIGVEDNDEKLIKRVNLSVYPLDKIVDNGDEVVLSDIDSVWTTDVELSGSDFANLDRWELRESDCVDKNNSSLVAQNIGSYTLSIFDEIGEVELSEILVNFDDKNVELVTYDLKELEEQNGDRGTKMVVQGLNKTSQLSGQIGREVSRLYFLDPVAKKLTFTLESGVANDYFGEGLVEADIDNDGEKDIIISAPLADGLGSSENGKLYVLYSGWEEAISVAKEEESEEKDLAEDENASELTRGEFMSMVSNRFELEDKNKDFLDECRKYIDFCLFNFVTMSSFEGIDLESTELILYPDVAPGSEYYDEITDMTLLGVVNGYLEAPQSPFVAERPITRIEALKVALNASELVPHLYRFELMDLLGSEAGIASQESYFEDVKASLYHMWWYPRYTNFAWEKGLIGHALNFAPDEPISRLEAENLLKKVAEAISEGDEKDQS